MVAKSFQSFTILGEPFKEKNKLYLSVQNPKTNSIRKVRFYSQEEYSKLYPSDDSELLINQKTAMGFEDDTILLIQGDFSSPENLSFVQDSIARCTRHWGWYIKPSQKASISLPPSLRFSLLTWQSASKIIEKEKK